jgi:hypothetical protein
MKKVLKGILILLLTGFLMSNTKKWILEPHRQSDSLIIRDALTNLVWMKVDFSFIENRYLNDWNEVFEWKDKMNAIKYAGFNDWRVPSIREYRSINKNAEDRLIYHTRFIELDSANVWGNGPYSFWSSSTPNKYTASYISFDDGWAVSGNRSKQMGYTYSDKGVFLKQEEFPMSVRLVRN